MMVFVNGILQPPGAGNAYTAFSDKIQFSEAPELGASFTGFYLGKLRQLDDIGFEGIMYNLQPAGFGMRVVGEALTVQETTGPFGSFKTEDFKVGHMIEKANPGDVIVVANNGAPVSTWGGMASYSAKLKGIGGLVVDGGIRAVSYTHLTLPTKRIV